MLLSATQRFTVFLGKVRNLITNLTQVRKDRGLVNGKTGTELVWEWLHKHDLAQYVSKVTSDKPRAMVYIDDKSIRFNDWYDALKSMEHKGIIEKATHA